MATTTPTPTIDRSSNRRPIIAVGAALGIAVVAWLAFGFFGIQAAFIDNEVTEAGPVFDSGVTTSGTDVLDSPEFQEAMAEAESNPVESEDPTMPGDVSTPYAGTFSGNSRYDITGDALVLNDGSEQRFLRFEDFDSSNGPDLNVYLRADDGSFIDLGDLKGNIGDQNYEIPTDVDLSVYDTVEIWCVRFGVGFGQAELMAA
ncbi:MAG: DM13 domain-containing protein [Acidimicrobiales bacterium]